MKFKNMKIAITDEVHLKAVCDVLQSMGFKKGAFYNGFGNIAIIEVCADTMQLVDYINSDMSHRFGDEVTLTDLLAMRDQLFMESLK